MFGFFHAAAPFRYRSMTPQWQPYREPLRITIRRTGMIALVLGAVFTRFRGGLTSWLIASLLLLWPSFGGHWVELWFLNWLRPRLSAARSVQVAARLAVWFAGGAVLAIGMALTALLLPGFGFRPAHWPPWWLGGLAFIAIELIAHLALQLRGRPGFYNRRG
jgi:hypothetical protein